MRYYRRVGGKLAQRQLTQDQVDVLLETFKVHKKQRKLAHDA